MAHILLIPAVLLGLIAAHLALVVYHKHTQYPGPGRNDGNVVGYPVFPVYMAKAGGFFFIVFGVITLMGGLMQINPLWTYGPYNPAQVTAGSQPDWYMGFVEGAIRIMPNWESHIGNTTWSWNVAIPGLGLMGLMAVSMMVYPFVEQWVTGDKSEHHILDRPRNVPTRTAFGVAAMTCYGLFWIGGGNDIVATQFDVSLNSVTYFLRVMVFVGPVIAFIITKRICIALQRSDAERLLHGSESAIIVRDPSGGYSEAHSRSTRRRRTRSPSTSSRCPWPRSPSRVISPTRSSRPSSVVARRPGSGISMRSASRPGPSWKRLPTMTTTTATATATVRSATATRQRARHAGDRGRLGRPTRSGLTPAPPHLVTDASPLRAGRRCVGGRVAP